MATISDIKKKLKGYKNADVAARDLANVVTNFKSLRLQDVKQFVYPNRKRENCVSICGTIPVIVKGQKYNIPIIFWIHPKHPYESPVVYVLPTGNMDIQPSQYVDTNGRVYLPYLNDWKVSTSDLSALCQILCITFADHCPVYSKLPTSPLMLSPQTSLNLVTSSASHVTSNQLVITDIGFLSVKEEVPQDYVVVENACDGKRANFVEGRRNRFICYCKKQTPKSKDFRVVTGLVVLSVSERAPHRYQPINNTRDSGMQAFKKKQLLVRFDTKEDAKVAVTDIVLLRAHSKQEVPNGFKLLPEIGGLHICFKTAAVGMSMVKSYSQPLLSDRDEEVHVLNHSVSSAQSPLQSMRPRTPAITSPYSKTYSDRDQEVKDLKERNAQLQVQLDVSTKFVSDLQVEVSQLRNCDEEVQDEVHYVNVQRSLLFGVNDAIWKVKRNEVTIVKEIGRGASGLVSKGSYRGEEVAVKQIHQSIIAQEYVMDEFKREVRIMASIKHPNLVRFIGAVFDESVENFTATPLLLLELLQTNLRRAYENSDLGFFVTLSVFRDVAYGLHYLHEHQEPIIHRDVSAPNILLEALPGGMWRAKLSDFGSANFLKRSKTPGVGAIVYTAPEMFPRQDPTAPMPRPTVKCDVFSFGIVLVEVITRNMPSVENRHRLFQEVQRKWHAIHDLTIQCTQSRPSDRPTMSSVLNTLHHIPPQ